MARSDFLSRAYSALEELVSEGVVRISVSEVAKRAGIGRATINQSADEDWRKFRNEIRMREKLNTESIQRVNNISVTELRRRVKDLEAQVGVLRGQAAITYSQLIDRVQYYYALAAESPKMRSEKAKLVKELTSQRKHAQILKSQLDLALANSESIGATALIIKKIILSKSLFNQHDIISSFIHKLYEYRDDFSGSPIVDVFLTCGLPLSGADIWIDEHRPTKPGVSLYIDCICVREDVRKLLLVLLRREFKSAIHCVRLRANSDVCRARASMQYSGSEQVLVIKDIEDQAAQFQEVHFAEDFDSVILA